ncbi:MAG: ABC transporter ATP-binding protein [Burkholderiaceae bacterium]
MATLTLERLWAFYGQAPVLRGINLAISTGEIVTVLGRNGSGRSTLAKAIMGLVRTEGALTWAGVSLANRQPFEVAQAGIGFVPETRDVFPDLTVEQNLQLGLPRRAISRRAHLAWGIADVLSLFPQLEKRLKTPAGVLSGGEQQMLSLARSTLGQPQLLIVDEPTEGLAPQLVMHVAQFLTAIKSHGGGGRWREQKLQMALAISDRVSVMGGGTIVFDGTVEAFQRDPTLRSQWLEC